MVFGAYELIAMGLVSAALALALLWFLGKL